MKYGCQSMSTKCNGILLKKPQQAFISQDNLDKTWEAFNYFGCPDYEKTLKEYEKFEKIIKDNIENVYYLPQDDRTGLDSIYTHDPVKITRAGAIYFPMGKELRSKEYLATEEKLKEIGIPTLGYITPPGKMEGGDVLWLDEDTVAIGQGYRTNAEGIRQFKELTKDVVKEYIIVPMPHGGGVDECLHLMSIISFVDVDKAVVYSKFMPVFFRELLMERGIQLIECNDEEYDALGSNVLCMEPGKCVVIDGCPDITEKMHDAGVTVFTYEGKEMSFRGTGGPTCLTCPLQRD